MNLRKHALWLTAILATALITVGCASTGGGTAKATSTASKVEVPSAESIVAAMTVGWNLGNTFDATGGETKWGNPVTTKAMIDGVAASGINTIRIPVTWDSFTGPAPEYKIDPAFIARVKEVVDYAVANKMYIILNMHHEDKWLKPQDVGYTEVEARFIAVWKQIATYFGSYDYNLMFEAMNEPRIIGGTNEWNGGTEEGHRAINKLNAAFVKTVRGLGGNNPGRSLLVTPFGANAGLGAEKLDVPREDNLIVSLHSYEPIRFTNPSKDMDVAVWDGSLMNQLTEMFDTAYTYFIMQGYPVIFTEFGACPKEITAADGTKSTNEAQMARWASNYIQLAKKKEIKCVWWDNGKIGVGEDKYGVYDRNNLKIAQPILVKAMVDASKAAPTPLLFPATAAAIVKPKAGGFIDDMGRTKAGFGTPTIDGVIEATWGKTGIVLPGYSSGPGIKATAEFKVMWDENNLYLLAMVKDPVLNAAHKDSWEQDSVELFLDEKNDKAKTYQSDDGHLRIRYDNKGIVFDNGDLSRIKSATAEMKNEKSEVIGYIIEAAVAWQTPKKAGEVVGFELQVNDAGNTNSRLGTITLYDNTNSAWAKPSAFGELILLAK